MARQETAPLGDSAPTRSNERFKHGRVNHGRNKEEQHVPETHKEHPSPHGQARHRHPHRDHRPRQHHPKLHRTGEHHPDTRGARLEDTVPVVIPLFEGGEPYRSISPTEIHFSTPQDAQREFAYQRALHPRTEFRRAPTPFARRPPDSPSSDSDSLNLTHRASDRSIGSRVSFGSHVHTIGDDRDEDDSHRAAHGPTLTRLEPGFGSALGLGQPSDALRYAGLARKEPRHRVFQPEMLRPALRGPHTRMRNKPLPHEPSRGTCHESRTSYDRSYAPQVVAPIHRPHTSHGRELPATYDGRPELSRTTSRASTAGSIVSLFRGMSTRQPKPSTPVEPAHDLFSYLRLAEIEPWRHWPVIGSERQRTWWERSFGGNGRQPRDMNELGAEWQRRLQDAIQGQMVGRQLKLWEAMPAEKWLAGICDSNNFPSYPIHADARWGSQTFALKARGFVTAEYDDDGSHLDPDFGLLSHLCGTILETAISALNMIRQSADDFLFRLVPSPRPPYASDGRASGPKHALWDGFGTFVLANQADLMDRAMLLAVRPPSVMTPAAMRQFTLSSRGEGWFAVPPECSTGHAGQANLLQQQVYDDAVSNCVYYFVVTNMTQWVFGHFNANYTKATVGLVIELSHRDPNVMQCLTTWVVRSIDERPRTLAEPPSPSRRLQQPYDYYPSPPMTPAAAYTQPMPPMQMQQPMYFEPAAPYSHATLPMYGSWNAAGSPVAGHVAPVAGYASPVAGHVSPHSFGSLGHGNVGWYGPAASTLSLAASWGGLRM